MHCLPVSLSCFRVFVILYVLLHPPHTRIAPSGTRCRTASMIRPDNASKLLPMIGSSKIWITKTRKHEKDKRIVHHDDPLFARFLFVLSCFRDPFVLLHPPHTRIAPSGTRCHTVSMMRPDNASNSWPMIVSSKIWITKARKHEKDKRIVHYDNPVFARFPFVLS